MRVFITLTILPFFLLGNNAFAAMSFQPEPKAKQGMEQHAKKPILKEGQQKKHTGMQRKKPGMLLLQGEGASVSLIQPDGVVVTLEPKKGVISIPKTGLDNYHALVAEKITGTTVESAIRYLPLRGKPSGHSPSELTALTKTAFEILPDPLPREHWHYTAGRNAVFTLRLKNEPAVGIKVLLTTAKGSVLDAISDHNGRVAFQLPEDFENIQLGRRKNPPAEFILEAEADKEGKTYLTTLSDKYYVNPSNWQSFSAGLFVMAIGMSVGLFFVVKNHRTHSKKGGKA